MPSNDQPSPAPPANRARLDWIEAAQDVVAVLGADYPGGHLVDTHRHSRSQLLYAMRGVVMVSTVRGRWLVPPSHAIWLPAELEHSVEMLGDVRMLSAYVRPTDLPGGGFADPRVLGITPLMHELMMQATSLAAGQETDSRADLVRALLLHEIPALPERPLGLSMPADRRLKALCRAFIDQPSARGAVIAEWADSSGMSRRSFTRNFLRETGVPLSLWRQQACLFAALPRLAGGESVTSVAIDLGYDHVASFITMFRRMLGMPPSAYFRATGRAAAAPRTAVQAEMASSGTARPAPPP